MIPRSLLPMASRPASSGRAGVAFGRAVRATGAALLLAATAACAGAQRPAATTAARPAAARADTAALRRAIDSLVAAYEGAKQGVVGYAVHNLDTGERLSYRGGETFPTASLIKVPILVTLFDLVEKKAIALDDPITILKIDQVPGSGQLQHLRPGVTIRVGDAARYMITISDNTATNLLLDRVAMRRVWEKMEALGLPHTKVHSKTFQRFTSVAMDSSVKYGLGVTTPDEMAALYARLAAGTAVSARNGFGRFGSALSAAAATAAGTGRGGGSGTPTICARRRPGTAHSATTASAAAARRTDTVDAGTPPAGAGGVPETRGRTLRTAGRAAAWARRR